MGIDNLTTRLANLSPAKRVLLELRLKQTALDAGLKQTISRRKITSSAPLSFSQQRLWFLDQYEPNSSVYNIPSALRLRGALDIGALEQSLNEIIRRHEILRTTFSMLDGKPIQVIAPSLMVSVPVIDLRDHPEGEREQKAQQLAKEEARQPFDLAQGPLFRSRLLRLGEDDYVLLLAMHHIVSDGWSMGVFYRELSLLYGAFSRGEPNPLEDLAIQYADFAVWQREWLQGEVLEKQLSYWKNQLEGIPGVLHLPTDRPRPAVQSYRGARRSIQLSRELTERLKALSRREGVTLFMTLLAAFQTLLYRYSGQKDIVVGSPIANRNRAEIEGLIGFFVNTLILRTDLSGNPTFRKLLQRVRKTALEAYEHQDLPFEKLVEELKPKRSLNHQPLFQVMFVLQNGRTTTLKYGGLTATSLRLENDTTKFDLILSIHEDTEGLTGSLRYRTDLFDDSTITRMLEHLRSLLESVVADPEQPLTQVKCLSDEDERELLNRRMQAGDPAEAQFDELESFTNITPLQFQFWVGQKLNSGMASYNIVGLFTIAAAINPGRFGSAFQTLIAQTDALRTVIEEDGGIPHAKVLAHLAYSMEFVDFSSKPDPHAALQQWVEDHRSRPFEFDKRLFNTALIKLSKDQCVWYLNIHHMIGDGWSFSLIFQRMQALYRRSLEQPFEESRTPSFQDYVAEERAYRRSVEYEIDQAYWKRKLAQAPEPLNFYGQAPAGRAAAVRRVTFRLGGERSHKIKRTALQREFAGKTANVSLFNIFAAIFAAYLHRISGNECISIGAPLLNRAKAYGQTVGLFMQVVPLRLVVSTEDTFASLIEKMQVESSEAQQHRRFTLTNYQHRLYDAIFNYHNTSFLDFNGAAVEQTWLPSGNDTASLSLHLRDPDANSLSLQFDFHPDVFHEEQQGRAIHHFEQLLDAFLNDPNQAVRQIDLLSREEKHRLLFEFNHNEVGSSKSACVHQIFESQVEQTPEAVALVSNAADLQPAYRQQLTYRELNTSANQLAHLLRRRGVGPGVLVGVCFERSVDAVVAVLGVVKAGGIYFPLDPNYPAERLSFMLEDSQAAVVVTEKRWAAMLPSDGRQTICLDAERAALGRESVENPTCQQTSDAPVYVTYTSGSSGRAKGVVIAHHSLVSAYSAWKRSYRLHDVHAHLQMASFAFDVFSGDLVRALCSGGKLVLCPAEILLEPALLYRLMRQEEVDWAEFVPLVLRQLLQYLSKTTQRLEFMRALVCGSDTWHIDEYRQTLLFCGPMTRLINSYGLTEATIDSSYFEGVIPDRMASPWVPIGRPFAHAQLYVLDAYLRPLPLGVSGELYVGGQSLAQGYLNQADLTAEKFIPDPFSSGPGSRLYKTGDRARYLPDGNVEFLGRVDQQVKIRGFRVETGEIEATLAQHPLVRESVVVAQQVSHGERRLVAYVVAQEPTRVTKDLRNYLKDKLPSYMVPSVFVLLKSLPLTPNGKVDRKALPAPEWSGVEQDENFSAPRNPVEDMLAGIWAEVLGLDNVDIHDNFFSVGGHSLLATQVVSRLNQVFQVDVPLRNVFENPTIAKLAERIEDIRGRERNRQLFPILRVARKKELPLSFSQQRLWFLDQYEPNSSVYNIPSALRLRGALDIGALEQSLNEIIRRHEILRTTFSMLDGKPIQVIAPSLMVSVPVIDLRDHPEGEREQKAQQLAKEEARQPFDLAQGPLFRSRLLRLGEDDYVLLLAMHHIVSDGWSMGVFYRELSLLYGAFSRGEPNPLEDLAIQYADFAVWQREWLQGEVLEKQLSYWKNQLEGIPGVLHLPTDRPRPAVQSYRGARRSIQLSRELTERLKALSRREGVTLFMTLLAAFQTVLYRYTGQKDIVVGSPIANRNRTEIEELIGFFVNTLLLRSNFSGNPTFKELLAQVREMALGAYAHQDLPFEKLVEELQPERSLSHSPLFQVMFVLQNAPSAAVKFEGLSASPVRLAAEIAKFDLTLSMSEAEAGLRGSLQYRTDLFDATTIARMTGHLQTLLESIVANPDQRISRLPILTQAEQDQLLIEWNDTQRDYPKDKCIHELFEAQVEKSPDAVAVTFEDQQLSYRTLNKRANQLAHYLRKRGVGPDVLVAICVERSLEMMVGLLGILKAGGAYVPLDPEYPNERLAFMLEDAQPAVLLTQARVMEKLPNRNPNLVCLDRDWEKIAAEKDRTPITVTAAENLAYVVYTSGSTGQPKGVEVRHQGVLRLLVGVDYVRIDANQSFLHLAPSSFDASTFEIWGALLHGARCVLFPEKVPIPNELGNILRHYHVSTLWLTASLCNTVIDEAPEALSEVRQLLIGGEALSVSHVRRALGLLPGTQIINGYGPTESTTFTCCYAIPPRLDENTNSIPIGRPIANTKVYLLDSHLSPVPIGISGELYIGGDGLARGYLNRPELTAEKFIPHPFSHEPGARLYKTGDLARYLPDGNIEFLGRTDHQVKIRGFRIELGEVETILRQQPAVREAVVLAREEVDKTECEVRIADGVGENPKSKIQNPKSAGPSAPLRTRLVAYVVPKQEPAPTVSELCRFLKEKLPDYMVPSVFVFLNLPLTPNGKIDRRALPVPDEARPKLQQTFVAPRTPVEERLAMIWCQVLGVKPVGVYDNFFELGGDSILSIQIIARANRAGLRLTPKQLFQHQTVAELAQVAHTAPAFQAEQGAITGKVPLTPIQHWFFEQQLPAPHHWNMAVMLEVRQVLSSGLLAQAVHYLVRYHDVLRARFMRVESGWQQCIATVEENRVFTQVDLSTVPECEHKHAMEQAVADAQGSLSLSQGPVLRVVLFDLGAHKPSRLLIVIHHLVVDGVSWRILLDDLQTIYQQLSRGEAMQLPPKTTSFKAWAERLAEQAQSQAIQQELEYWLAVPRARISRLPVDYPGGKNTEGSKHTVSASLSDQETRALLQGVPKAYHTQINDVLLTALVKAFADWTGAPSLLIDLEGHGREELFKDVDLSRTVGWFTTIFPVLLDLESVFHPEEALKSVKEQLRHITNRGIGYGMLRYLCGNLATVERLQALPKPEVSFNYLGQFDQVLPETSPFVWTTQSSGSTRNVQGNRPHLLAINGRIIRDRLQVNWTYSESLYRRTTIESLTQGFIEALRALIAHCVSPAAGGYTPSDFPAAKLSQKALDGLIARLGQTGGGKST